MKYSTWGRWSAINDIDRRLDALEANARQMDEIDACQSVLNSLKDRVGHASDCAVNNAPAYFPGPCNCKGSGEAQKPRAPGWYWVKFTTKIHWFARFLGEDRKWYRGPDRLEEIKTPTQIGPRIQEPSE